MDTAFHLPELPRLLPVGYHPRAAAIEFASNGWVRHWLSDCFAGEEDLLRFLRQRNGLYGSLTVPEAPERRAQDISDWYQYVPVNDSFVPARSAPGADTGKAGELFGQLVAGFDGEPQGVGYGPAAQDLWRRIGPGLSEAQRDRFRSSLAAFLRGCATEIPAKLDDAVPDYETCLAV